MIRRPSGSGIDLITQVDHASLSGVLAGHVGNNFFTRPTPEVVAAIAAHDAGWPLHDDQPTLNLAGSPLHVFETPPSLSTGIWSASVERATELSPYTALLVSLHQLNLSDFVIRRSRETGSNPFSPRDVFELNKFQHRQIEIQESLRKKLGFQTGNALQLGLAKQRTNPAEDRLRFDFRLLVLCDSLSLELCCGKSIFPAISNILPNPSAEPVQIDITRIDDETLQIHPWPFDVAMVSADVPVRHFGCVNFADPAAFQKAYANAAVENRTFQLRSGGL